MAMKMMYERAEELATNILKECSTIENLLENELSTIMRQLNTDETFKSRGAGQIVAKFETLKPSFKSLKEELDRNGLKVKTAVKNYREADAQISKSVGL